MRRVTFEALELFGEKVEKLLAVDFVKTPKLAYFDWHWNQGDETVEITGPRSQDIDAFLLTYRFFFDKNEHCSLRWLAENVIDDPGLSKDWKRGFLELRANLNTYLDSFPLIKVTDKKYPLPMTNREVKDLFLFGDFSHTNLEKRKRYNELMSHPAAEGLLFSQFVEILIITFNIIIKISNLCKLEINKNIQRQEG